MMMAVALAAAFGAWAETETVGDYTWTYRINDDAAEIYNNNSANISPDSTGAVTMLSAKLGIGALFAHVRRHSLVSRLVSFIAN